MASEHQKASDVFASTEYLFGRKVSFAEAFPTIEEATVVVVEEDMGGVTRTHRRSSRDGGIGEFVDCSNRLCYNGGVRVGEVLRDAVSQNLTEYEAPMKICQGYEGSPKGRRKVRDCLRMFKVKVTIRYKNTSPPAHPPIEGK